MVERVNIFGLPKQLARLLLAVAPMVLGCATPALRACTISGAVRTLPPGAWRTVPIEGGGSASLSVQAPKATLLRFVVDQDDPRLSLCVAGTDGTTVRSAALSFPGTTILSVAADKAGPYTITATRSSNRPATLGIRFRVLESKLNSSSYPEIVAAEQFLIEAQKARGEPRASSLRRAIALSGHAQQSFRRAGDTVGEIRALLDAADTWRDLSDYRNSDAAYKDVEKLASADPVARAAALNGHARLYLDWWDGEPSRVAAEEALKLSRAAGDRRGEAAALTNLGEAHYLRTDDVPAAQYLVDGMTIAEEEGSQRTLGFAVRAMGWVAKDHGQFSHVIELMRRAEGLFQSAGDLRSELSAEMNVTSVQSIIGDRESVLSTHLRELQLAKIMSSRIWEAFALEALGTDYARTNDHLTAIGYYRTALSQFRILEHKSGEFDQAQVLCRSELATGAVQAAVRDCSRAMTLANELKDPMRQGVGMDSLADTQARIGKTQRAKELYNRAAELSGSVGDPRYESASRLSLGELLASSGEHEAALSQFRKALALSTTAGLRDTIVATRYEIARTLRAEGKLAEAREELEAGLRLAEEQRARVGSAALRASYFTSVRQSYELYVQVLMELHRQQSDARLDAVALEQSEKAHARSLLDALVESGAEGRQGRDPQTEERMRAGRANIEAASNERMRLLAYGAGRKQLEQSIERIRLLNAEYEALETAPHQVDAAAAPEHIPSLSLEEIQRDVLDSDTTLLEYLLGDDGGVAWAVTSQQIISFDLPPRRVLESDVQRWHALMLARKPRSGETAEAYAQRVRRADRELQAVAAKLACTLLGPAMPQLHTRRLAIVPDGGLEYIAFAALPLDGCGGGGSRQPLVSRFEVVVAPSASNLLALRRELQARPPADARIAVLADPVFTADDPRVGGAHASAARPRVPGMLGAALRDMGWNSGIPRLPGTRLEAQTIAARAGAEAEVSLDFQASLATALRPEMSRYRILHFATHGLLDAEHPEFSGLVLSLVNRNGKAENGYLSAQEIYGQRLLADLVVLSACDSGLGVTLRGEGMVGLSRAFLHAGAARVVSSLWKVDDEATSELMRHFYEGMIRDKKPPAAALRYAQLQVMRQKRWSAPFYWAGFVLNGEWR